MLQVLIYLTRLLSLDIKLNKEELLSGAIGTVDTEEAFKTQVTNCGRSSSRKSCWCIKLSSGGGPGAAPVVRIRGYATTNDN